MEYGVTDKGFVMKRFDTILKEVQEDLSGSLGFDVSQNPQSLLNSVLIIPFCDKIAEMWEVAQESYYAKYPSTAEGVNLDNACQYSNVFRRGNKHTEYTIHCTAKDGTIVPEGSLISSITNPVVQLKSTKDSEITRSSCNTICIKPVTIVEGTYNVELNGKMYSYKATGTPTAASIVNGLAGIIEVAGYTVAADTENGTLTIEDTVAARSNDVSLSSNLTTEYVVSLVHYYTVDYGDIQCPEGTICEIASNVTGLISVVNKIEPTPGRIQQSDISFRQDYIRKSYGTSSTMTESIEAYILENVAGVKDVRCYENPYNVEDELGRPPHCVEVIVDGGDEEAIAKAILTKKSGGIETCGDIMVNVLGEYGDEIPIKLRRPEPVYAWINVELTTDGSNINPDYVSVVQQTICEKASGISIGDSLMSQTFIAGIYQALAGISYCKIHVASSSDMSSKTTDFVEGNISANQRQAINVDASRIEVNLST